VRSFVVTGTAAAEIARNVWVDLFLIGDTEIQRY
jgi:hypothetical protein